MMRPARASSSWSCAWRPTTSARLAASDAGSARAVITTPEVALPASATEMTVRAATRRERSRTERAFSAASAPASTSRARPEPFTAIERRHGGHGPEDATTALGRGTSPKRIAPGGGTVAPFGTVHYKGCMAHVQQHGHRHAHGPGRERAADSRRLAVALALILALMIGEVVAGAIAS